MSSPRLYTVVALLGVVWAPAEPVGAQSGEVRVDFGAARSLPPSGTDAIEASYLLMGLAGERWWTSGSGVGLALLGGRTLGAAGNDWATGQVVAQLWTDRGTVDFGLGARGYAFRVGRPFVYETTTAEVWPQVRISGSRMALTFKAEGGYGGSHIAFHQSDDRVRRASPELWHYGGGAEVETVVFGGILTGGGAYYEGAAGPYRQGLVGFARGGPIGVRVTGEAWDTPHGVRYAGSIGVHVSVRGGWSLRLQGGRGEPDPLVRAPQGVQGGAVLGLRLVDLTPRVFRVVSLEASPGGRFVARFALPGEVGDGPAVLGDFSGWEAMPMRRRGDEWVLDVPVGPGTYHFGFEIDGSWYLPPEAPGRVSDDWGQENGTLVVPTGPSGAGEATYGAVGVAGVTEPGA